MTAATHTALLFSGIIGVLTLASLVGFVLARRYAGGPAMPVIANLNARVRAWWGMVAVTGLAFAFGPTGVVIMFGLASLLALREFVTLIDTRRADHWALLFGFFVVVPVQYYLVATDWYALFSIFIPVYAFMLVPVLAVLRGDTTRFMERIAEVQWGLMICVYCISHVAALVILPIPGYEGRNLLLVSFLVLTVQSSDVMQYVFGKLFGRRKLAANLSPSKTVEGLVGGVASATALGAALWWITPFSPWQAAGMALMINLMGFLGGLVMSAIKRDRGAKDWGHSIAGHGGVLDRLDSVVFAAPLFFHFTRYWWVP